MTRQEIIQKLQEIFDDTFYGPEEGHTRIIVTEELTGKDTDQWDSLMHIILLVNIERALKISFTLAELGTFKNVGDIVTSIEEKLK